ncbi:MAG: MOSC domain-containing protein [Acidobacteriota bacterium]|nr:MOSC domain-containing protein [Acidobacteriota bacterium]
MSAKHLTLDELETGLVEIRISPVDEGALLLIVRRPSIGGREVLDTARLDLEEGLVGDNWRSRGSRETDDGSAHPEKQVNIMNARSAALVAGQRERWPLAGDQLYVDLNLSGGNLPPGTRLAIGTAVIEVTEPPHTGCAKFVERFGMEAMRFVNSDVGRQLNLRGINAKVVTAGEISVGDVIRRT